MVVRAAVKTAGFKGSCGEVEAWYHEESPGEAIGKSAAQLQKDPSILKRPAPWDDNQEQEQQWNEAI